jgi:universal stress protein A
MIPPIAKILYATDLTKNSSYAFYFAVDLARKHDANIIILHCVKPVPPSAYAEAGFTSVVVEIQKEEEENQKEQLSRIKDQLQKFCEKTEAAIGPPCVSLVSDVIVRIGYPVEEILNTADAEKCDVIVLGTHGKGWLKQTFLGSTARTVLERTHRPVFIIPLASEETSIDQGTL